MSIHRRGPRLALLNPIDPTHPIAERELALRMADSTAALGWETRILSRSDQVRDLDPDAVLCLHPQLCPKLTDHPWLACYWNPPSLLKGANELARTLGETYERTYDAYLASGPDLTAHLQGLMPSSGHAPPVMPFHTSSPRSNRSPSLGPDSRLFYVGSNWDGRRFPHLLRRLAEAGVLALHGTAERWTHLPEAYQGALPFDGRSVIETAHRWGMGLCLHLPHHRAAGVPNMRLFELAAAGALIVADRNPFVETWFGDTVLYVDVTSGEEEAAAQILDRVSWVRVHLSQARDMAAASQAIFNQHLCLEVLFEPLPDLLSTLRSTRSRSVPVPRTITILLPWGPGGLAGVRERLTDLAGQIDSAAGVTLTALVPAPAGMHGILAEESPVPGLTLRPLPQDVAARDLLATTDAMWFALMPEGVRMGPRHLGNLLEAAQPTGAALAAGVWPVPPEPTGFPIDPEEPMALAPERDQTLAGERWLGWAALRAAGLLFHRDCLDATVMAGLDHARVGGWPAMTLYLALAVAARATPEPVRTPGAWLHRLPGYDPDIDHALSSAVAADPYLAKQGTPPPLDERPPSFAGISDLDPELAAGLPYLWRPDDFRGLPPDGPIWLYGSSQGGELVLAALEATDRARVSGFLDSHRQGEAFGLPVQRPGDLPPATMAQATVIISAQYVSDIIRTLRRDGASPAHLINAYPYIAVMMDRQA